MDYPKSVPSVGLVNGKFVDENPANGTVGSLVPAAWGNAVTTEILNVILAANLQPNEADLTQLTRASLLLSRKAAALNISRFLKSGTFTVPKDVTTLYVSGSGGGGGGGGGGSNNTPNAAGSCGAGGGAGEPAIRVPIKVTPGQVLKFVIGGGGLAGVGGAVGVNNATPGGNGGDTVITGVLTLKGGKGGAAGQPSVGNTPAGGYGGIGWPSGGSGSDGCFGSTGSGWAGLSGAGASGPFGGGGTSQRSGIPSAGNAADGISAHGFGAAGGGGSAAYHGVGRGGHGGKAVPGLLIIEW